MDHRDDYTDYDAPPGWQPETIVPAVVILGKVALVAALLAAIVVMSNGGPAFW